MFVGTVCLLYASKWSIILRTVASHTVSNMCSHNMTSNTLECNDLNYMKTILVTEHLLYNSFSTTVFLINSPKLL